MWEKMQLKFLRRGSFSWIIRVSSKCYHVYFYKRETKILMEMHREEEDLKCSKDRKIRP